MCNSTVSVCQWRFVYWDKMCVTTNIYASATPVTPQGGLHSPRQQARPMRRYSCPGSISGKMIVMLWNDDRAKILTNTAYVTIQDLWPPREPQTCTSDVPVFSTMRFEWRSDGHKGENLTIMMMSLNILPLSLKPRRRALINEAKTTGRLLWDF